MHRGRLPVQSFCHQWGEHHVDGPLHFHNGCGPGLGQGLVQRPVVCGGLFIRVIHGLLIQRGVWRASLDEKWLMTRMRNIERNSEDNSTLLKFLLKVRRKIKSVCSLYTQFQRVNGVTSEGRRAGL